MKNISNINEAIAKKDLVLRNPSLVEKFNAIKVYPIELSSDVERILKELNSPLLSYSFCACGTFREGFSFMCPVCGNGHSDVSMFEEIKKNGIVTILYKDKSSVIKKERKYLNYKVKGYKFDLDIKTKTIEAVTLDSHYHLSKLGIVNQKDYKKVNIKVFLQELLKVGEEDMLKVLEDVTISKFKHFPNFVDNIGNTYITLVDYLKKVKGIKSSIIPIMPIEDMNIEGSNIYDIFNVSTMKNSNVMKILSKKQKIEDSSYMDFYRENYELIESIEKDEEKTETLEMIVQFICEQDLIFEILFLSSSLFDNSEEEPNRKYFLWLNLLHLVNEHTYDDFHSYLEFLYEAEGFQTKSDALTYYVEYYLMKKRPKPSNLLIKNIKKHTTR